MPKSGDASALACPEAWALKATMPVTAVTAVTAAAAVSMRARCFRVPLHPNL